MTGPAATRLWRLFCAAIRRFGGQSQLIGDDPRLDLFKPAGRDIAQQKRAIGHTDEPAHMMAQIFHDPAHLAVLALANGHCQPCVAGHLPVKARADLAISDAVNRNAIGNAGKCRGVNLSLHAYAVFAAPAGAWQFQMPRQPAIICQQNQPFGIHIQPPDGQNAGQLACQRVKNRFACLFIAVSDHKAARLVIAPEPCCLAPGQRFAINRNAVGCCDIQCRAGNDLAIHADASVKNACLGLAARTESGAGNMFGDPFRRVVGWRKGE